MKKAKRWLALVLTCLLAVSILPGTALAADVAIQNGQGTLTVYKSKVAFAGCEWWVIGDSASGVYPKQNNITLLEVTAPDATTVPFRTGKYEGEFDDSTKYSYDGGACWFANNKNGLAQWKTPNEYVGSTLWEKMEEIAGKMPIKEQGVITPRAFVGGGTYANPSVDEIAGQGGTQKVWSLSEKEYQAIANGKKKILPHDNGGYTWWWLRTPSHTNGYSGLTTDEKGRSWVWNVLFANSNSGRPAFSLNLSTVLFTSVAKGTGGKASGSVGFNPVAAEAPTAEDTVKFTMKHSSQTLTVNATLAQSKQTGETLNFSYSDATMGTNQFVSCVLTDGNGAVKYYVKLADSSEAASGSLSVPLKGAANGTYTLKIFSEEANAPLYTDFCSEPVTMTVTMKDGIGTVSNFKGNVLHEHSWSEEWQKNETHHWHECTVSNCPITDNSKKDSFESHTFEWVIDADATEDAAGSKHEECTVCRYAKEAVEIPMLEHTHTGITKHDAVAATCNSKGNVEYWTCSSPKCADKYYSDADCTSEITTIETAIDPDNHTGDTEIRDAKAATEDEEGYTGDTWCTGCNTRIATGTAIPKLDHTHSGTLVPAKEPTFTEEGNKAYYTCSCCKWFEDAACTVEITDHSSVIIPMLEYAFTAGNNGSYTKGSGKDLKFTVNGAKDDCHGIKIDSVLINEANYTLESGSTIITLKNAYLETLDIGSHTIAAIYGSKEPTANFKIAKGTNIPRTGDNSNIALWMGLAVVSIGGIAGLTVYSRKRKKAE